MFDAMQINDALLNGLNSGVSAIHTMSADYRMQAAYVEAVDAYNLLAQRYNELAINSERAIDELDCALENERARNRNLMLDVFRLRAAVHRSTLR